MTVSSVVVLVFAIFGAVQAVLAALGTFLPATNKFGAWCRTASADVKKLLGFASVVK